MANKLEAVISFKLEDKGLKDAAKELEQLKKQLEDLSKQRATADTKTPAGQQQASKLDSRIQQTKRAISAGEALTGEGANAEKLQTAFRDELKGRNPGKMLAENVDKALRTAIKKTFGDLGEALKNPVTRSHFDKLIEEQVGNVRRQAVTPPKAQPAPAAPPPVATGAPAAVPAAAPEPVAKRAAASPSEAAPDFGPMAGRTGSKLPGYLKDTLDTHYNTAKSLNLVDQIIGHAASGMTKKQIAEALQQGPLRTTSLSDISDIVEAVRQRHRIPSSGPQEGLTAGSGTGMDYDPNAFLNWRGKYMEAMGQTPAPNQTQQTGPGLLPEVPPPAATPAAPAPPPAPTGTQLPTLQRLRLAKLQRGAPTIAAGSAEAAFFAERVGQGPLGNLNLPNLNAPVPPSETEVSFAPGNRARRAGRYPNRQQRQSQAEIDALLNPAPSAPPVAAAPPPAPAPPPISALDRLAALTAAKGKRAGIVGDIFGRGSLPPVQPTVDPLLKSAQNVLLGLDETDATSSGPPISANYRQNRRRNAFKGKRFANLPPTVAESISRALEDIPEGATSYGSMPDLVKATRKIADAEDVARLKLEKRTKAETELTEKIKAAQPLYDKVVNNARDANRRITNPLGDVADIRNAKKAQGEIWKLADQGGFDKTKVSAVDNIHELDDAAHKLAQTFVGAIKPATTMAEALTNVSKKAELLNQHAELLGRYEKEPDKDQRKQYARELHTATQALQSYTSDPAMKRQLSREDVTRMNQNGLNQNMMGSFGQYLAGNVLLQSARSVRAPYQATSQAFDAFNQEHQVDPALLSSQRRIQSDMLNVGGRMGSYRLLKNNLAATALESPLAPGAAVAGDLLGAIAGPGGAMLQTGASLHMAAADNPLMQGLLTGAGKAGVLGLAGLAGGAVGLGLGGAISGKDPFKVLQSTFFPKQATKDMLENDVGGNLSKLNLAQVDAILPKLSEGEKALAQADKFRATLLNATPSGGGENANPGGPMGGVLRHGAGYGGGTPSGFKVIPKEEFDKAQKGQEDALKNLAAQAEAMLKITDPKASIAGHEKDYEYLKGVIEKFQEALGKGDSAGVEMVKKILDRDPTFQLQKKQLNESWNDFYVDMAHSVFKLNQGYERQTQDISLQQSRASRDFAIQEQRLGVSRTRAGEDYGFANRQNDLQITRTRRNVNLQLQRQDEDYAKNRGRIYQDDAKNRLRLEQDSTKQLDRLYRDVTRSLERTTEDSTRSMTRTQEDAARSWQRTVEDTSRSALRTVEDTTKTMTRAQEDAVTTMQRAITDRNQSGARLMEDTGTSRSRLAQDYNRTVVQQNRSFTRSNQDLDQGYQDSILGIVAPGLTSNPGYQLARLTRDYAKNKTRLGEDYQTNRQDLNINVDRQFADLAKGLQRGIDDLNKSFQRTVEDVNKSLTRTAEDIAVTLQRSSQDIATTLQRTGADIATTLQRAGEDMATTMQRATADAATAVTDGVTDITTNFKRTMDDLNTNLQRATADMDVEHFRAYQDAMRQLQDAEQDYQTNRTEIQKSYNRTLEDLNNAEADLKRSYNDTLVDLNTAQKRAKEDYDDARSQLTLSMQRFNRDFENSLAQLAISVTQAGGALASTTISVMERAITTVNAAADAKIAEINRAKPNVPGVPGLNGMNQIPADGFGAVLHHDEMVITKPEAQYLRSQGYRPESKNLKQVLPKMMKDAVPHFAAGFNGGSITWPGNDPRQWNAPDPRQDPTYGGWNSDGTPRTRQPGSGGGTYQTPSHTTTNTPLGFSDPGMAMQVQLLNQGQRNYSAALENLYGQMRGATTASQRAALQTEGDRITATYRSGGFNTALSGGGTTTTTGVSHNDLFPVGPGYGGLNQPRFPGQGSDVTIGDFAGGISGGATYGGGYPTNGGNITGVPRSGFRDNRGGIGTGQGLTSGNSSGIINASNSIVPPSIQSRNYGTSLGNMAISVSIQGGSAQAHALVNQAVNAFGRDLTNRGLSIV